MDEQGQPTVTFDVEMGEAGPVLRVRTGERSIPIAVAPNQAVSLAQALIAASAVCVPGQARPPVSTPIRNANALPVLHWQTGTLNASGLPVLIVKLLGEATLTLLFSREKAAACGAALQTAAGAERTVGQ